MISDDFSPFFDPPSPLIRYFISDPLLMKSDLAEPSLSPICRHIWTAPKYTYDNDCMGHILESPY